MRLDRLPPDCVSRILAAMHPIVERLKQRKIVQWALAYLAAAWLVSEVVGTLGGRWGLPLPAERAADVVLVAGFLIALVLAWYHGERGRQHISGVEIVILTGIMGLGALGVRIVLVPAPSALPAGGPLKHYADLLAGSGRN